MEKSSRTRTVSHPDHEDHDPLLPPDDPDFLNIFPDPGESNDIESGSQSHSLTIFHAKREFKLLNLSRRPRLSRCLVISVVWLVILVVGSAVWAGKNSQRLAEMYMTLPDKFRLMNPAVGAECTMQVGLKDGYHGVVGEMVIAGNRTTRFRDALLPHVKYITAFVISGWTNDVIAYVHLLQLAILTQRVPVIPPFQPSHVGHDAGFIPFGTVFNVSLLQRALNIPILEWYQLKNYTNPYPEQAHIQGLEEVYDDYYGGESEEMGCWSLWMTQEAKGAGPREGGIPRALGLELSWTPVPFGHQIPDEDSLDYSMHELAALAFPQERKEGIRSAKEEYLEKVKEQFETLPKERLYSEPPEVVPVPTRDGKQIDPDEDIVCYDYLYFVATHQGWEWWDESSPAWNLVGRHMYWSDHFLDLARSLLIRTFELPLGETMAPDPSSSSNEVSLPPFISVHIRRRDFSGWCGDVPRKDCLAPLSAYVRRVEEVREGLRIKWENGSIEEQGWARRVGDVRVVVMTDEPKVTPEEDGLEVGESERWWGEIRELGWLSVDHIFWKTEETYGAWYPSILDACMLSLASGFVGTASSTYTLLAKRRVEDWAGGPTRVVQWGSLDADAHRRRRREMGLGWE